MSKLWEVDPETRSRLQEIAQTNENNRCVDCGAPSPQWASPKFGIFFCLACSGIHRSLGVHISFVRSVSMDAFKTGEVRRMQLGGNKPWKEFFNSHSSNALAGQDFDSCTISERYDSEAGEEWKERLTAKVEGAEYVPGASRPRPAAKKAAVASVSSTPAASGRNTPLAGVKATPQWAASPSQKSRNEAYFAKMGQENANRPEGLAPSQGGKYAGFGSSPLPPGETHSGVPTADEFQQNPVAALTKGFGWLSSTVSKQAASVNKSYIQPGMKNLAASDFGAQVRTAGMTLGNTVQQGTRGLGDQFHKFVDPDHHQPGTAAPAKQDFWDSFGQAPPGPPQEKKDFWDDFAAAAGESAQQQKVKPSTLGTSAMKHSGGAGAPGAAKRKDDDQWGEW